MITGIKNADPVGDKSYVGVTPGKTYSLTWGIKPQDLPPIPPPMSFITSKQNYVKWINLIDVIVDKFIISWSSEINKQTITVPDY